MSIVEKESGQRYPIYANVRALFPKREDSIGKKGGVPPYNENTARLVETGYLGHI